MPLVLQHLVQAAVDLAFDIPASGFRRELRPVGRPARSQVEHDVFLAVDEVGEMPRRAVRPRKQGQSFPAFMRRTSKTARLVGGHQVELCRADPGGRQDVGEALSERTSRLDVQRHGVGDGEAQGLLSHGVSTGSAGGVWRDPPEARTALFRAVSRTAPQATTEQQHGEEGGQEWTHGLRRQPSCCRSKKQRRLPRKVLPPWGFNAGWVS